MAEIIDIFRSDAFSQASLTTAINAVPYLPQRISDLGVFNPTYHRTALLGVEEDSGTLSLIQTSKRGEPLKQSGASKRKMRFFEMPRIAMADHITASELAFVRQMGSVDQVKTLATELMNRMSGPVGLVNRVRLTWENMFLGAISGQLRDADGSLIYDWYDEYDLSVPSLIDFDLDNANPAKGALRKKCQETVRSIQKSSAGAFYSEVRADCGDAFWDDFIAHADVARTYEGWTAAAELRNAYDDQEFRFAGITWSRYRGTDDGTTVAIATDECRIYPAGRGNSVFEVAFAPGESFADLGTEGQPLYSRVVLDDKRDEWVDLEVRSYPLAICKRPAMLRRGKRT